MRAGFLIAAQTLACLLVWMPWSAGADGVDTSGWIVQCRGVYNLCHFVDRQSGALRLSIEFEKGFRFANGLAAVRVDGKYGYVDETGKMIITPQFDLAGEFVGDLAEVLIGDHTGIIDREGKFVLPPAYARALPLANRSALVREGQWTSPYIEGYERLTAEGLEYERGDRRYTLIDLPSRRLLADGLRLREFDFHFFVWAARSGSAEYGLLAPDGTWKIAPKFETAERLSQGRSIVCTKTWPDPGQADLAECGAIDGFGDVVVELRRERIDNFQNGFYRVRKNGQRGVLNGKGELIGNRYFDDVRLPEDGDVSEVLLDGEWVGLRPRRLPWRSTLTMAGLYENATPA